MQIERWVLCVVAPPLAVMDKGINEVIVVAFFTVLGWVPGVMVAFGFCVSDIYWKRQYAERARTLDAMQNDLQQRTTFVNLPDHHRSGADRYETALRGEAMRQRHESKNKRNRGTHHEP
jgi:uncharacterized membrane protein YqaE (UPF0057 family)